MKAYPEVIPSGLYSHPCRNHFPFGALNELCLRIFLDEAVTDNALRASLSTKGVENDRAECAETLIEFCSYR